MKALRIFVVVAVLFALSTCGSPLAPVRWTDAQKTTIAAAIDLVSETEATNILTDLAVFRHVTEATPAELTAVEDLIMNRFDSYGLTTERVPVTLSRVDAWDPALEAIVSVTGTFTMNNLIATRPGTDSSLPPVYVTTHWDCAPNTVGADDNGSGVVGALETARVLQGLTLERDVVFVLFAFEEDDFGGSEPYVSNLTTAPKSVLNLEMIGFTSPVQTGLPLGDILLDFPAVGDFIGVVAADFSRNLGLSFCTVANEFVPTLPTYMIGADAALQNNPLLTDFLRSDHISFLARGMNAIMITDTADLRGGAPYHTPDDTMANIDFPFMVKTIKVVAALTALEAGLTP